MTEPIPSEELSPREDRVPAIAIMLPPVTALGLIVAKILELDRWVQGLLSQVGAYWTPLWVLGAWGLLTLVCAYLVARDEPIAHRGIRKAFSFLSRFIGAATLHVLVTAVVLIAAIPVLLLASLAVSLFR